VDLFPQKHIHEQVADRDQVTLRSSFSPQPAPSSCPVMGLPGREELACRTPVHRHTFFRLSHVPSTSNPRAIGRREMGQRRVLHVVEYDIMGSRTRTATASVSSRSTLGTGRDSHSHQGVCVQTTGTPLVPLSTGALHLRQELCAFVGGSCGRCSHADPWGRVLQLLATLPVSCFFDSVHHDCFFDFSAP